MDEKFSKEIEILKNKQKDENVGSEKLNKANKNTDESISNKLDQA
jgi:hypothetical protein